MAIHWKIQFKSLRTGTVYTVNIYDDNYTGTAVVLKGGAQPFTTQEDDDDDLFTPIRTQTGYIRIVDDGKDANGNAFDWRDMVPETDISRPVTLTAGGTTLWKGFMQAQDFGSQLYGNPQEREFPVQCPLSVTEGADINYQQKEIRNFAYLLQQILSVIPSECRPSSVMVQGGADARTFLMKQIDWQNFATEDGNGNMTARFTMYQCLEDMCRFWGWTARTSGSVLWLIRGAAGTSGFLSLSTAELNNLAEGTSAGSIISAPGVKTLTGDIFANTSQQEILMRGVFKATVNANGNSADPSLVALYPQSVVKQMNSGTDYTESWTGQGGIVIDHTVTYTGDITTFSTDVLEGSASGGTFNMMVVNDGKNNTPHPVVRIRQNYNGTSLVSFETVYEHSLCDGTVEIRGTIYKFGNKFDNSGATASEQQHMWMRVGVGKDREHAVWATPGIGGHATWGSTPVAFRVIIGNNDELLSLFQLPSAGYGLLFIDLLGSDDFNPFPPMPWSDHTFEIADFSVAVQRSTMYLDLTTGFLGKWTQVELSDQRTYTSTNSNKSRDEWETDCIFASDNDMAFGYGVVLNENGLPMAGRYDALSVHPEQTLADTVASFWNTAATKFDLELRYDLVGNITPQDIVQVAGTTCYATSIGHEWRDDIIRVTALEW